MFSEAEFESLALQLAGFSNETIEKSSKATNANRFKDFCYAGGSTLNSIFEDIQHPNLGENRVKNPSPVDLIHALYFLKKYPTAHEFAGRCGNGTEKTVINRAWKYIRAFQALKRKKIRWIFDQEGYDEYFLLTVDGVHCRIWEPRTRPSSGWFSKKYNKAGLTYELGVAVYHNQIVWVNGPFPAGQNDIKVFRKGLKDKIPDGCCAIGDEGYRGEPSKVATKNEFNSDELKRFQSRARARHETVNSRLKAFGILAQPFRCKSIMMEKHKAAMEACLVIVQYELENGSPLFKI